MNLYKETYMGHYASEMDPDFGRNYPEEKLLQVGDDLVRDLARCLFKGYNTGSHLDSTNTDHGIKTAAAIDALIRQRVHDALYGSTPLQSETLQTTDDGKAAK
jgi:hypothetical protein